MIILWGCAFQPHSHLVDQDLQVGVLVEHLHHVLLLDDLHLVGVVVAGILAGTCGYSGNDISPSTAAIFWANQDLQCATYSVEFSMITCFTQNLVTISPWLIFYSAEFSRVMCFTLNLVKISTWQLSYFKAFQVLKLLVSLLLSEHS
jgi:hypothetical protein